MFKTITFYMHLNTSFKICAYQSAFQQQVDQTNNFHFFSISVLNTKRIKFLNFQSTIHNDYWEVARFHTMYWSGCIGCKYSTDNVFFHWFIFQIFVNNGQKLLWYSQKKKTNYSAVEKFCLHLMISLLRPRACWKIANQFF